MGLYESDREGETMSDYRAMSDYVIELHRGMPSCYREAIGEILSECDDDFVPPLSSRRMPWQTAFPTDGGAASSGDVSSYLAAMEDESFLCATTRSDEEEVIAFLSYMPGHVHPGETCGVPTDYVSTICVRPAWRGRGIARSLYKALERHADTGTLTVRTWSTNTAQMRLLPSLGYAERERIADDRGPGIDTVYFAKAVGASQGALECQEDGSVTESRDGKPRDAR